MTSFQLKKSPGNVSYLVCEPLEKAGFANAFSTRESGDLRPVDDNRRHFGATINLPRPIVTCHQTHSTRAHFISKENNPSAPEVDGDALATDRADVLVGVKTADCVPILVGDPQSGIAAAIHAGWRGALGRIVEKTLARLKTQHGFNAGAAVAAVGPSACVDCYEVGPEVMHVFREEFTYGNDLLKGNYLDVPQTNVRQLIDAGLSPANIYVSQYCTMRDTKLFFSHRREGSNPQGHAVGRLLSVIGRK